MTWSPMQPSLAAGPAEANGEPKSGIGRPIATCLGEVPTARHMSYLGLP